MPALPTSPPRTPVLLDRLDVFLLDVQTTGASPARGHLLEVAWARTSAARLGRDGGKAGELAVESRRVALPAGAALPPRISALTGITAEVLRDAVEPNAVWRALERDIAGGEGVPAVAHVARFEQAFLASLHARACPGVPFPLRFLCTHEIACRLLPELPRRGLSALAGRFGHPPAASKRAEAHVRATAAVWAGIVERLREQAGVVDEAGLRRYLEDVPARRRAGRSFAMAREVRLDLPEQPGVYRMLGRAGNVLYVGKATSLKRRVNGYFQKRRHTRAPMLEMLTQVFDVEVTCTATALEAALLESDEIKRHQPPYNVQLRRRDLDIVFLDPTTFDHAAQATAATPVGPVSRGDAEALAALRTLVDDPLAERPELWRAVLRLADEAEPDGDVLRRGLRLFLDEHADAGFPLARPGGLLGLGRRLWRVHLDARQVARDAAAGDAAAGEAEAGEAAAGEARGREEDLLVDGAAGEARRSGPWVPDDPEAVARALERSVLLGTHAMRRARLLNRLSECTLTWCPAARSRSDGARRVVLDGGRVTHAEDVPFAAGPLEPGFVPPGPPPPGWPRGRLRRARAFDLATLDRMRVFLKETKRLVALDVELSCCLGPRTTLTRAALAARLAWV